MNRSKTDLFWYALSILALIGTAFYIYESSYIPNKSLKNNKTSVRAIVLPKKLVLSTRNTISTNIQLIIKNI